MASGSVARRPSYRSDSDEERDSRRSSRRESYGEREPERPIRSDLVLHDLLPVILKRDDLEKWYGEPYFNQCVPGLYVRITYGSTLRLYRLVEILSIVDTTKTYKLGKKECHHLLAIKIGNTVKDYEMQYVSNSPVNDTEFKQWVDTAAKENELPSKQDLEELQSKITHARDYKLTDADIAEQIKRNRERHPQLVMSFAHERLRLQHCIEEERGNGDLKKVEEYKRQLQDIRQKEAAAEAKKFGNKTTPKLSQLNKRNINADKQTRAKAVEMGLGDTVGHTPQSAFARRHTIPQANWLKGAAGKIMKDREGGEAPMEEDAPPPQKDAKLHPRSGHTEEPPQKKLRVSVGGDDEIDVQLSTL